MTRPARTAPFFLAAMLAMVLPGCSAPETPAGTSSPVASHSDQHPTGSATNGVKAVDLTATAENAGKPAEAAVEFKQMNYEEFQKFLATNPDGKLKYTLVDAWGTFCGPCKENFPHVVEMHHKFAPKGLRVVSLSFDDPEDDRALKDAEAFLVSQKAVNTNILLNEENGVAYEKFNVNAIPAVFLFGPDGKEVKRFTLDDPNNQFTYADVEKTIGEMLGEGK